MSYLFDDIIFMTEQNITEHSEEKISNLVLQSIGELLHSSQISSHTYTRPLPGGGGELAECVIGEPIGEDKHVILSTFGTGGVETEGTITVQETNKQYAYHSEFFMVASDLPTAKVLSEELANIAFTVNVTKQSFTPGMVIGSINGNEDIYYVFSEVSFGEHKYSSAPIFSKNFAVAFVAVNRVFKEEVEVFQDENKTTEFLSFLESLGNEAYSLNRTKFVI